MTLLVSIEKIKLTGCETREQITVKNMGFRWENDVVVGTDVMKKLGVIND